MMSKRIISKTVLTLALMSSGIGMAVAVDDVDSQIAHARAAAPASIGENATIVINGAVAVEGGNGWTCMPDTMPGDRAAICIDAEWGKMMTALSKKEPYTATVWAFHICCLASLRAVE